MKILTIISGLILFLTVSTGKSSTITWTNTAGGNWSDSANWSPQQVPGTSDFAVITNSGNYTVNLNTGTTIGDFMLGATNGIGSQTLYLGIANTLTVNGLASVFSSGKIAGGSGGILAGNWTVLNATISGALNLATNSVLNFVATVPSSVSFEALTLTSYGTVNWSNVNLSASSTSQIENYGLWEAQGNDLFTATSGTTTFNNHGVFRKSAGFLTYVDYNIYFNNWPDGTVDIQSGTTYFSTITDSGVINTATNTMFAANPCFLMGSPVFSGQGLISGSLSGGFAVVNGVLNLTNAALGGTMTLATNSMMNFVTSVPNAANFAGLTLTNYGTVNWSNVNLSASSTSQIYNYGLWDAQMNDQFSGSVTFNNYGIFRKSGGVGFPGTYFDYSTVFNNYDVGTVEVKNGIAYFSQIGNSGTNIINANSRLFSASCFLTGSPVFSGAGQVAAMLYGGNAVVNGVLNLTNSVLSGTLTLASNSMINLVTSQKSAAQFSGLTLTNYGTVNWSNVNLSASSSSQICNYGLWDCQMNNVFNSPSGTTTFNNYGVLRKSGGDVGSGSSYFDYNTVINNTGTMDAQAGLLSLGGVCDLTGGTLNFGISSPTDYGTIYLSASAILTGTMSANLKNGYAPTNGSTFAVLSYGSATGAFTALNLPHLSGGLIWQTNAGGTNFSLSVTSAPPFQLTTDGFTQNGTNFGFSFGAIPGQIYQVQSTTNLAPANWLNLGDPITATNNSVFVSDLIGTNLNRFYRVILQ